jgi:hypothetical protein
MDRKIISDPDPDDYSHYFGSGAKFVTGIIFLALLKELILNPNSNDLAESYGSVEVKFLEGSQLQFCNFF